MHAHLSVQQAPTHAENVSLGYHANPSAFQVVKFECSEYSIMNLNVYNWSMA
jgi:hypothetical protein